MAEVLLKVGSTASYDDGDIIEACSDEFIQWDWAEIYCHRVRAKRNRDGLIIDPMAIGAYQLLYRYRTTRVSATEAEVFDSVTGKTTVVRGVPSDVSTYMNVDAYIKHAKKKSGRHHICLVGGRETWFGGDRDTSPVNVSKIWDVIELTSDLRRQAHTKMHRGRLDLQSHLAVSMPMTHQRSQELIRPRMSRGRGVEKTGKRRYRAAEWESRLGLSPEMASDIRNPRVRVDLRDTHEFDDAWLLDKETIG